MSIAAVESKSLVKDVNPADGSGASQLHILRGIDLRVETGESLAILGTSGSGKTTLLSLLAGLDLPTSGECWLNGQCLNHLDEDGRAALRAGNVGFVFQSFQLLPGFSALENVMLAAEMAGDSDADKAAREILGEVGLKNRIHHLPHQLSGGEQQRVAVARAFAGNPGILFADEPTGNLDTETGRTIIDLIFNLNEAQGTTLILVTHDAALADHCQRVVHLREGLLHE